MITTLVAAGLIGAGTYNIKAKDTLQYDFTVLMDGFLPVLGGNEGKAEVAFGVLISGLEGEAGNLKVSNELTSCAIKFNGAKVPLTLANVTDFFPKTTVVFAPSGQVIKNDAPDRKLPFRLPGLDVKRFPDITYLPIEFPADALANGQTWTFKKSFGEADLNYTCTVSALTADEATIQVGVKQEYDVFENETAEIVKDQKDAESQVHTTLDGTGEVHFDIKRGIAKSVHMLNKSVSKLTDLATKAVKERKLDSTLDFKLKATNQVALSAKSATPWESMQKWGAEIWGQGVILLASARLAVQVLLSQAPGLGAVLRSIIPF